MREEPGADSLTLVHGVVHYDGVPIGHAWIVTADGQSYDPVTNEDMPMLRYLDRQDAVVEQAYTRQDFAQTMADAGHWGPWHDSAGICHDGALPKLKPKR